MPKKSAKPGAPAVKRTAVYPSLTGRTDKDGNPKLYLVQVNADGTASCTCPDFSIGTNKRKDPLYRCKHLELELGSKGRGQGKTERVPVQRKETPPAPAIDILGDETFEPRARRGR